MHLIKFWPGDWFKQMKKMNQAVVENNSLDTTVGRKCPVRPFIKKRYLEMYWVHYIGSYLWG